MSAIWAITLFKTHINSVVNSLGNTFYTEITNIQTNVEFLREEISDKFGQNKSKFEEIDQKMSAQIEHISTLKASANNPRNIFSHQTPIIDNVTTPTRPNYQLRKSHQPAITRPLQFAHASQPPTIVPDSPPSNVPAFQPNLQPVSNPIAQPVVQPMVHPQLEFQPATRPCIAQNFEPNMPLQLSNKFDMLRTGDQTWQPDVVSHPQQFQKQTFQRQQQR